jgi:hypothetical protein
VSRVVLFRSRAADMALRLEYILSLETPAEHLVVEMPPGQDLDLLVEDRPPRPVRVNSQGVLAFADGVGGTRRIILRPR